MLNTPAVYHSLC